ncbi:MAG: hypothetical protein MI754_14190, partial [Chromatiales bacterium]|nr:hypothetical protein [Chromatiales bacterium]
MSLLVCSRIAAMQRIAALLLLLLLVACGGEQKTPEQQVRQLIKEAEVAVEKRSVTETMPFVSREYSDQGGRDRKMLTKLLAGYFLSHQNIHLLVQVKEVTTISDEQVRAELLVAMA